MLDAQWVGRVRSTEPGRPQWGKRATEGLDQWVLLANPARLSVADVYRLFVFDVAGAGAAAPLVQRVRGAIDGGLGESVEAYFKATT
jgi:membrane protein